jgi:hypothetical protein
MPSGGLLGPNSNAFQAAGVQTMPYPLEFPAIGQVPGVIVDGVLRGAALVLWGFLIRLLSADPKRLHMNKCGGAKEYLQVQL